MTEFLQALKSDLLSRRLLPFVALVVVALVAAVGYAVAGGSGGLNPAPVAIAPSAPSAGAVALPVSVAPANPNEAVSETPGGVHYQSQGPTRDPFIPLPSPPAAKSAAATSSSSKSGKSSASSSTGSSPGGTSGTGSSGAGTGTSGSGSGPVAPSPPVKPTPRPVHPSLSATQSYGVALALTAPAGGLDTIDPLERLSVLPSAQQPLLVYLGVLKGGRDALFVVQPGTVVSGPGTCAPGPTDCEILSLAQEQVESLAVSTAGGTSNVALFAVTAINVKENASADAANRARREVSAAGRALLAASTLPALPLFEYQPDVGAVVDLRNLEAGGK
jgi:hypothetical protein